MIIRAKYNRRIAETGMPFDLGADAVIPGTGEPIIQDKKVGLKNFGNFYKVLAIRRDHYLEFFIGKGRFNHI